MTAEITLPRILPARRRGPVIGVRADQYQRRRIEWVWPGRLARGMQSILDGDPDLGKSQILAYIAGRITTGRAWPDGTPCPKGGFVIVGAEDSIEEVLVPRLDAVGADRSRVHIIDVIRDANGGKRLPCLPDDIPLLEDAIWDVQAAGICFDPIMPYLSKVLNPNSDKDTRQALTPMNEMLVRTGCMSLMLRHLNKNDKVATALYRGLSSIAFVGLSRTGMAVAKNPDVAGEYVLAMTKANIAKKPSALTYRIEEVTLDDGIVAPRIAWVGETSHTANSLITAFGDDQKRIDGAEAFLRRELASGPLPSDPLKTQAEGEGIKFATFRRAKEALGIKHKQIDGRWFCALPEHVDRLADQMLIEHLTGGPVS